MKQSVMYRQKELFAGSKIVNKRSFRIINTRDKSALLAVICPVQTAVKGLTRGHYAHFHKKDCFECLSPHETAA